MTKVYRSRSAKFALFSAILCICVLVFDVTSFASGVQSDIDIPFEHEFFSYDQSEDLNAEVEMVYENQWFKRYVVRYDSEGDRCYSEYYEPKGEGTYPAVVMLHGMFSRTPQEYWEMGEFYARRGVAVIFPSLPHHHERKKFNILKYLFFMEDGIPFVATTPEKLSGNFRQAVVDSRRAVDWLMTRDNLDKENISIAGVSLGGLVSALAFKVEPRFSMGTFLVIGGALDHFLTYSQHLIVQIFNKLNALHLIDREAYVREMLKIDPYEIPDIWDRPVMMFNAQKDMVFSVEEAEMLLDSFKDGEIYWTSGEHYPSILASMYVGLAFMYEKTDVEPRLLTYWPSVFSFSESVRDPEFGKDSLIVDVSAIWEGEDFHHEFHVPLVNKFMPFLFTDRQTYEELGDELDDLSMYIYIMEETSKAQCAAAFAYSNIQGQISSYPFYFVRRSEDGASYDLYEISSQFELEMARNSFEAGVTLNVHRELEADLERFTKVGTFDDVHSLINVLESMIDFKGLPKYMPIRSDGSERFTWIEDPRTSLEDGSGEMISAVVCTEYCKA